MSVSADEMVQGNDIVASGVITVQSGLSLPEAEAAALYITVRPERSDFNDFVRKARATNAAPIAAVRISPVQFPYEFKITEDNLFPEAKDDRSWALTDLQVSARWDTDGVAATRGSDDLVGGAIFKRQKETTTLELQTRGLAKSVLK